MKLTSITVTKYLFMVLTFVHVVVVNGYSHCGDTCIEGTDNCLPVCPATCCGQGYSKTTCKKECSEMLKKQHQESGLPEDEWDNDPACDHELEQCCCIQGSAECCQKGAVEAQDEDKVHPCLSENDKVLRENGDIVSLKDIVIGDYIFDGDSFTKVLTVEYGAQQEMFKFNLTNKTSVTSVTMTENHLLYDLNNELIRSDNLKIGDIIFNNYVVNNIENEKQYSATPVTFSGYLQVNGIKVSSYTHGKEWAKLAHKTTFVFRWLSKNVNQQFAGKIMEWLTLDAPNKYYLPLRELLGEQIAHNEFYFYCIAMVVIPTIIIKHLFISVPIIPVIIIITSIKYWRRKLI